MSRVVIFGECMLELSAIPEDAGALRQAFAGDTYNTAVYLKRCFNQADVQYLTAIGQDFLSSELLLEMGNESIGCELVLRSRDKNLGLYMVRTDDKGERTFAYWRNDSAARQTLDLLKQPLSDVSHFYFSGISLAILDDAQRDKLFDIVAGLKQAGCKIIFDPNYRARLWPSVTDARKWIDKGYGVSDIAFPGGDDHLSLYGHGSTEDILNHVRPFGIGEVVLKNGAYGVHILANQQHAIVPVEFLPSVVDTTAAGDAFNGGYLAARLAGRSPTDAASYGAKVAAVVIGFRGAIVPKNAFRQQIKPLC